MKTHIEVLEEAKTLLEKGWTQGEFAKDATGRPVSPSLEGACVFCMVGAVDRASNFDDEGSCDVRGKAYAALTHEVLSSSGSRTIVSFNDAAGRTKEEVIGLFERAISKSKGDEL